MDFLVHLALDRFGAEALGRLFEWIPENRRLNHLFVWLGAGDPPSTVSRWSRRFPPWAEASETKPWSIRREEVWKDVDRGAILSSVAAGIRSDSGPEWIRSLVEEEPDRRFGRHLQINPHVTLSGSFADPFSSSSLLGLLMGFSEHRRSGAFSFDWTVFGSLGARSADVPDQTLARGIAARTLVELRSFLMAEPLERASPIFLVGERIGDTSDPDRPSQISLLACGLEGLIRSVRQGSREPSDPDPFWFFRDRDGGVHQGLRGRAFSPEAPFTVLGAHRISSPLNKLYDLVTLEVCRAILGELKDEIPWPDMDALARLNLKEIPDEIQDLIQDAEQAALTRMRTLLESHPAYTWTGRTEEEEPPSWFDFSHIRHCISALDEKGELQVVIQERGRERLRRRNLTDWPRVLQGLHEFVEEHVMVRRQLFLDDLKRRNAIALLLATQDGLTQIFSETFIGRAGSRPHRAAQAFIAAAYQGINKGTNLIQREFDDVAEARLTTPSRLPRLEEELSDRIAEVPSPLAVQMRFLPVLALVTVFLFSLPTDWGFGEQGPLRLLYALSLGSLSVFVVWWHYVERLRRQIFGLADSWISEYGRWLKERDRGQVRRVLFETGALLQDGLRWFLQGHGTPPVPAPPEAVIRRSGPGPLAVLSDELPVLSVQDALRPDVERFDRDRDGYRAATEEILSEYQPSLAETILPEVSPDNPRPVEEGLEEVWRAFGEEEASTGERLRNLLSSLPEETGISDWVFPYRTAIEEEGGLVWRLSFGLDEDNTQDGTEDPLVSVGYRFFSSIRPIVEEVLAVDSSVGHQLHILREQERDQLPDFRSSPLFERLMTGSVPSARAEGGELMRVAVPAGEDDPYLVDEEVHWPGDGSASLVLQCQCGLDAESVIFFPNSDRPSEPLGRAWKRLSSDLEEFPVLSPAIPAEGL